MEYSYFQFGGSRNTRTGVASFSICDFPRACTHTGCPVYCQWTKEPYLANVSRYEDSAQLISFFFFFQVNCSRRRTIGSANILQSLSQRCDKFRRSWRANIFENIENDENRSKIYDYGISIEMYDHLFEKHKSIFNPPPPLYPRQWYGGDLPCNLRNLTLSRNISIWARNKKRAPCICEGDEGSYMYIYFPYVCIPWMFFGIIPFGDMIRELIFTFFRFHGVLRLLSHGACIFPSPPPPSTLTFSSPFSLCFIFSIVGELQCLLRMFVSSGPPSRVCHLNTV